MNGVINAQFRISAELMKKVRVHAVLRMKEGQRHEDCAEIIAEALEEYFSTREVKLNTTKPNPKR